MLVAAEGRAAARAAAEGRAAAGGEPLPGPAQRRQPLLRTCSGGCLLAAAEGRAAARGEPLHRAGAAATTHNRSCGRVGAAVLAAAEGRAAARGEPLPRAGAGAATTTDVGPRIGFGIPRGLSLRRKKGTPRHRHTPVAADQNTATMHRTTQSPMHQHRRFFRKPLRVARGAQPFCRSMMMIQPPNPCSMTRTSRIRRPRSNTVPTKLRHRGPTPRPKT